MSAKHFKSNPTLNELIAFEDGTHFALKNKNDADNYAKETKQKYTIVKRSEDNATEEAETEENKPKTTKKK